MIATVPCSIRHVIVDRDGVLNREAETGWVTRPELWQWEDGSLEGLRTLSRNGIRISVATNQSCIGRGLATRESIERLHRWLIGEAASAGINLAGIFVCPHAPADDCACRKPRPGLILDAIRDSGLPRDVTIFIGDDTRDLEAGRAAEVAVGLVRTGKGESVRERVGDDVPIFDNLHHAARDLVAGA